MAIKLDPDATHTDIKKTLASKKKKKKKKIIVRATVIRGRGRRHSRRFTRSRRPSAAAESVAPRPQEQVVIRLADGGGLSMCELMCCSEGPREKRPQAPIPVPASSALSGH